MGQATLKDTLIESLLLASLAYSIFLCTVQNSPRVGSFEVDRLRLKKKKKKETLIESLLLVSHAYSIFLLPVKHTSRAESFEVDRLSLKKKEGDPH